MKSIIVRFKLHMNMIKPLSEYFYSSLKLSLCSILILFGLLPHSVTAGQDQWTKVGTLNTSIGYMYVNALSEIYVMSWRDSLHRYDGLVWESIETGLDASLAVTSFAYSDAGDKTLYVSGIGSTNPYVYQTSNGGNTWSLKTTGVVDDFVITVAADPNNTQVAWLGTDINGVYKTVNGGDSWVAKNNGFGTEGTLNRITVAPGNSSVVYAAGAHLGVFKTTDGGDNWTLLTDNAIFVNTLDAMVVNPANANQVFFITDSNELYRVTDNGSSVSEELFMDGMPVDTTLGSLVIDKNNSAIMYAGTLNGVYEWDNINTTWNKLKIGSALEGKFVSSLVIDPNNSQTLYAGTIEDIDITTGGVYHFQKGGIPPVAAITTDNPEVNPPDVVILNGSSSSDSDGSIVNYAWSQTAGPDVTLTNDTGFDTSFVSPNVESTTILTFQLTVTDNDGLTNSTSIDITVSPIPTGDGSDGGNNSGGNSSGGGGGCTIRSSAEFDPVLLLLIAVGLIYLARKRSMNKVS